MIDTEFKVKERKNYIKRSPFGFKGTEIAVKGRKPDGSPVDVVAYTNKSSYFIMYGRLKKLIKDNKGDDKTEELTMSLNALRVLIAIVDKVPYACNYVEITQRELSKELDITEKTIGGCINILDKFQLIKTYGKSGYIINHNYCMNGSLTKFYNDYKELYSDEFDDEEL